jgi:DNA-binding transcriptional LysR family regulator
MPAVLADLHLLTIIAQTRSLTQAAARLGISKASVSERLRDLERVVGMPLVHRTTRHMALTPQAAQLVEDTKAAFDRIDESFQSIRDLAGTPRGLLRITAPVALGRQRIAPCMPDFLHRYPDIRVELDLSDRLVNLAEEGFDLAIRHAQALPSRYVAKELCASTSVLMASREYLDRAGLPLHPADLANHACLVYLRGGPAQSWSFEKTLARRKSERVTVNVSGPFKANNSEVLREAIAGGLGIGLLPDFSAEPGNTKGLAIVLPAWRPIGFFGDRIYAVRDGHARAPRTLQCMIDYLRRAFEQHKRTAV